jgi:hypothetical protein
MIECLMQEWGEHPHKKIPAHKHTHPIRLSLANATNIQQKEDLKFELLFGWSHILFPIGINILSSWD